jgi:hypothetical protein
VIFSGEERGKAFGLYGAILGFASALGLVLAQATSGTAPIRGRSSPAWSSQASDCRC